MEEFSSNSSEILSSILLTLDHRIAPGDLLSPVLVGGTPWLTRIHACCIMIALSQSRCLFLAISATSVAMQSSFFCPWPFAQALMPSLRLTFRDPPVS